MDKFYCENIDKVLDSLNTSADGLSSAESSKRLIKYGKNLIDDNENESESIFKRFLRQLSDIMVIILIISGIISIAIALYFKNYQDLFEGILILLICFFNAIIGVIQEGKAENALNELKKSTLSYALVKRDNHFVKIPVNDIVKGDIVSLSGGDIVPADIRLISSNELKCNESCLTGESISVEKDANILAEENSVISQHKNMLYSKTIVVSGNCIGVVTETGLKTEIGKIAQNISASEKELTPIQKSLNKLNGTLSVIILLICAVVYVIEVFMGNGSLTDAFLTSITLAVAAVPESLPAVTSIIMAIGVSKLSQKKAIIKKLPVVETLGCCQIICSDKTGTLTMNKMEVIEYYLPKNNGIKNEKDTSGRDFEKMIRCMTLCNNAKLSPLNTVVGESTESALMEYSINCGYDAKDIINQSKIIFEIPFSSERKMMTRLVKEKFYTSYTKGSLEYILARCNFILCNGVIEKLSEERKNNIIRLSTEMNKKALRVLGFAYNEFPSMPEKTSVENNMIFIGSCGMFDPPRKEVYSAITECKKAGLLPIMITGDSAETAFSVAKELKICENMGQVITGKELNNISQNMLCENLDNFRVFARVNPEHKVRIVEAYQSKGKIVAMTGDGVNDAPSLKKANIGVAMGSGTEVAKSAGDMIVTDDNFSTIVVAIKEGRKIFQNIKKTLHFLFSTNLVEVITIFLTSVFFPQFIFLTPSQLLFINLVTDGLPAFSLGLEKAEKNIMNIPPRRNTNSIFTKTDVINIVIQAMYQIGVLMAMYIIGLKFLDQMVVSTMCFFTFSLMQINHSINMKTLGSIFKINIFDNKYFNFSYLFCIVLNILLAITPIGKLFSLSSLSLYQWIIILAVSFSIIPFVEVQKVISGKINNKS